MAKLKTNIKLSVWAHRKWITVNLSNEFSNINYTNILTNYKEDNIIGRCFEVSYNDYGTIKENNATLPEWNINKDILLKFKITDYKDGIADSKLVGLQKYIHFKRLSKIPSRYFLDCIFDYKPDSFVYRFRVRIYTSDELSSYNKTIIRNSLNKFLTDKKSNNSDFLISVINNQFIKSIEVALAQDYNIRKIDIQKVKQV